MAERFDIDLLDEDDPFEIDEQSAHLFKHPRLGIDDVYDVWRCDPLYPAKPPAHWLMVAEVDWSLRSTAVSCWCRSRRRTQPTRRSVARSAARRRPQGWPPATGRIDERQEDVP